MAPPLTPSLTRQSDQSGSLGDDTASQQKMMQSEQMLERMRLQKLWDDAVHNKTEYVRYTHTVVMMLSWKHSDLNQKEMEEEVDELGTVLEQDYGFEVHKSVVDSTDGPRKKLYMDLSAFVYKHDKPDTLLILYYAGHGSTRPAEQSAAAREGFTLFDATLQASKLKVANIAWEIAEDILFEAEHANLLVIFDCCEAGSLCKSRAPLRFEYLAACLPGARTKPAGPKSFTRALIWSLKELRNHERGWYPTSELRDKIFNAPNFPKGQYPLIGQRINSPGSIVLAPSSKVLDATALEQREGLKEHRKEPIRREYLDLRFEFHERITDKVLVETGQALKSLIHDSQIQAKRITFVEKHGQSRWPAVLSVVKAALRFGHRELAGHSITQTVSNGSEDDAGLFSSSPDNQRRSTLSNISSASPSSTRRPRRQSPQTSNDLINGFDPPFSALGKYRMMA